MDVVSADGRQCEENAGNVIVEVRWADGLNADVDLWMQAPGNP
jgi:hypothetical protein